MAAGQAVGEWLGGLIDALERAPRRKSKHAAAAKLPKGTPPELDALVRALAASAFSSLTIGDWVLTEDALDVKVPKLSGTKVASPVVIGESAGGDLFLVPARGEDGDAPVYCAEHDANWHALRVADSIEDFIVDLVEQAKERGLDVDIQKRKAKAKAGAARKAGSVDAKQAARVCDKFLRALVSDNGYYATPEDKRRARAFDPEDDMPIVLAVHDVSPKKGREGVVAIKFTTGLFLGNDPRPPKLASAALTALRAKHPELASIQIEHSIEAV
jgi:hypothetical protein